jgi:hypothetical protein
MEADSHYWKAIVVNNLEGTGRALRFAYFDTSAVVKRYVLEPGSPQVRSLLRRYDFLSSAITPLEILSALSRRKRTREISEKNFTTAIRRISNDRRSWELIELTPFVLYRAEKIIPETPMRTLDALHIASALAFQASAGLRIPFVTGDHRQRDAALQMNLEVIWIGE